MTTPTARTFSSLKDSCSTTLDVAPVAKLKFQNFPLNIEGCDSLPISTLIDPNSFSSFISLTGGQTLFCYQVLLNTIDSLLTQKYSHFDGNTTAHCCHGIAVLVYHLVYTVFGFDLHQLKKEYEEASCELKQRTDSKASFPCRKQAPKALINLASLYILHYGKELDPFLGGRTQALKLRALAPISRNNCEHISHCLKKVFANWAATSYEFYLKQLDKDLHVSEAPVTLWGKYIQTPFIRSNSIRGIKHASNLFSTQVVLAHLSYVTAKIALINDINTPVSNKTVDRYVCVLLGDGRGGFTLVSQDVLQTTPQDEAVVVFGGCIYSDTINKASLSKKMEPWLDQFPQLILACDVYYPQFFKIDEDCTFDSSPIMPEEQTLQELMKTYSSFGTHPADPSLYCNTHICTASLKQVLDIASGSQINALPGFYIPQILMKT